ncbi:MAG: hypothetical protein SGJ20_14210 [Planctomycetota bacterium]|nr:hypothetical protein [Planctomycetota bacterium]
MATSMQNNRGVWMIVGVLIGLAVGAMAPNAPLHASATHGQENFAMCTGEVEMGLEGVFTLDFLTGELTGFVVSLTNSKFTTFYKTNVLTDMGGDVKGAKFLMVTGIADVRQGVRPVRLGRSIIYIAELSSGKVAAYGVPFTPGRASQVPVVQAKFIPLDVAVFRNTAIRP